ncbi:MAG: CpsD/CapB family tyrosine-protein kinase [Clostridia bacterium]|nr:CpsD/CapB family tyrosine-protein kinase [Clostridia bacterium]
MNKATISKHNVNDYAMTEALNTVCGNLLFTGQQNKTILLTSCTKGEGKSYLSMEITENLAHRGLKVALIDADLRRSNFTKNYGVKLGGEKQGLAHYLAGYCKLEDALYETDIDGVYVIPNGRYVANPVPLISGPVFADLMKTLSKEFDYVIVDAPPIGLVVDAAEMAHYCDGTIFVITYNQTRRRELADAKEQIEKSGCRILGGIINQVTFEGISSKKYYYRYYYTKYGDEYYSYKSRK